MPDHNTRYFCAELAAMLGLEEAILFECLTTLLPNAKSSQIESDGSTHNWYEIDSSQLVELLNFWDTNKIDSVLQSARDKGLLLIASPHISQTPLYKFRFLIALDDLLEQSSPTNTQPSAIGINTNVQPSNKALAITSNWQPSDDIFSRLNMHNIASEFATNAIQPFISYYKNTVQKEHSWDNKFYTWCIRAWREYESHQQVMDSQPSPLKADWQPNHLFFDTLRQAQIPKDFALDQFTKFRVYYLDSRKPSGSWNITFFNWVERNWKRHQQDLRQNKDQSTRSTREISLHEKLTDDSWAYE